ncbi:MAG: hypothetical protein PVSMB9_00870 [Candidatus Dormibacteria bacterium]
MFTNRVLLMKVFQRVLIWLSIAVTLAGCAGSPLVAAKTGTVSGHVSTRACGGANRETVGFCQFQPAAGMTLSFRGVTDGKVRMASADARGFYTISLPAGTYQVGPRDPIPAVSRAGPRLLTVMAGQSVTADFSYTIQLL